MGSLKEVKLSEKTIRKHESSCHALGGYIIGQVYGYEYDDPHPELSGNEIIKKYIVIDEGPLIYHSEEAWQREIDATCKKLYKFINRERT